MTVKQVKQKSPQQIKHETRNLAKQVRREMNAKKNKTAQKKNIKKKAQLEQNNKTALIKEHGNKFKDDMPGLWAVYPGDWRNIRLSAHVEFSHSRLDRYARLTEDDYIMLSVWEPLDNKIHLFMTNNTVLIVGLNENNSRKHDKVITVIPNHNHIRKFTIDDNNPIAIITDKVMYD